MEYYFSSSLTKKLMAVMLLLLLTGTMAVSDESHCGTGGLPASGPCKDDYALCVANVITVLRDRTPYTEHTVFATYYPADQPSGGVLGVAYCAAGSSFLDCRSCLIAAKDWLDQNCAPNFANGYYNYDLNCSMMYEHGL